MRLSFGGYTLLAELKVESLGIIDHLHWKLSNGLSVITGETGAGKSLVIDAIDAILDCKLEECSIRFGADEASVEAVFFLEASREWPELRKLLEDKGIDITEESLVIGCEFRRQGRAILRLNGGAVTRNLVKELGHYLVDIHSQSEHLALFERRHHLEYLDTYAHDGTLKEAFNEKASEFYHLQADLESLTQSEREKSHREEILRYQVDEISRAKLKDGEEEELAQKRQVLASAEKLKALSYGVYQDLDGEESSGTALLHLGQARGTLRRLVAIDPRLKDSLASLEDTYLNLQELARDIRGYEESLDFDPRSLEDIDTRLEIIKSLKKKYGVNIAKIKEYLGNARQELMSLTNQEETKSELSRKIASLKQEMGVLGADLSRVRQVAAKKLAARIKKELKDLNLGQVEVEVSMERSTAVDGLPLPDGQIYAFTKDGVDEVEFMVSTNPGEPLKPLAAIASTGEISRFTLALKVALAEADRTPVLIFDEIDIGVGGRSGDVIGKKLWALSRHHQVICVTHLPQIAAFADAQFNVRKETQGGRTVSVLTALKKESRLRELAAMLGGESNIALINAGEIVARANEWIAVHQGK
jgi:DNA repair protein RecN (Recombination protein N)